MTAHTYAPTSAMPSARRPASRPLATSAGESGRGSQAPASPLQAQEEDVATGPGGPLATAHERLACQAVELSWLAPQVVAHRLHRMVQAGWQPGEHDQREFALMGQEKVVAFQASWMAMWSRGWDLQLGLMQAWERSTQDWLGAAPGANDSATPSAQSSGAIGPWDLGAAAAEVLCAGLVPLGDKARSNAQRLGRAAQR